MIKNKILIRINNLDEIKEYKKVGISNFLFALDGFSVGYNTFTLEELKNINENVYLLINRAFDKSTLESFIKIKDEFNFIKGIFFEDIAVYQVLKNTNLNLIWNQNHAQVSYNSINFWLNKVFSSTLSNELTKEEINDILDNVIKPVILPVFGLNMAMYSRRTLLTNYNNYINHPKLTNANLKVGDIEFLAKESEYGTVFFNNKPFNLINEINNINDEKILYYYIDAILPVKEMLEIINGKEINCDNRFFYKKTIYKIGDIND